MEATLSRLYRDVPGRDGLVGCPGGGARLRPSSSGRPGRARIGAAVSAPRAPVSFGAAPVGPSRRRTLRCAGSPPCPRRISALTPRRTGIRLTPNTAATSSSGWEYRAAPRRRQTAAQPSMIAACGARALVGQPVRSNTSGCGARASMGSRLSGLGRHWGFARGRPRSGLFGRGRIRERP